MVSIRERHASATPLLARLFDSEHFMDLIFRQLGSLFLGSIPTAILFLLLVASYTVLVDKPLRRVLAERRERTVGAKEKAAAAVADAEAKTREYNEGLRAARAEVLAEREKQVAGWLARRDKVLSETRAAGQTRVREAGEAAAADAERARAAMDPAIDALAGQVLSAVLPAAEARS